MILNQMNQHWESSSAIFAQNLAAVRMGSSQLGLGNKHLITMACEDSALGACEDSQALDRPQF